MEHQRGLDLSKGVAVFTYMLFVALTNLVMGIVLGYFYGPLFVQAKQALMATPDSSASHSVRAGESPASKVSIEPNASAANTPAEVAKPKTPSTPAAAAPSSAHAEDLRPIKQTGSREVTALDLADVMSELGGEPAAPATKPSALATVAQ